MCVGGVGTAVFILMTLTSAAFDGGSGSSVWSGVEGRGRSG